MIISYHLRFISDNIIAPDEFSATAINATILFTSSVKPIILKDIEVRQKN